MKSNDDSSPAESDETSEESHHASKPRNTKGHKNNESADETSDEEIHMRSKAKKQSVSMDKRWTKISDGEEESDEDCNGSEQDERPTTCLDLDLDVLGLRVYHPIWALGRWCGGSPKGLVHHLLMQFFTQKSSKMEVSETYFFDIGIT